MAELPPKHGERAGAGAVTLVDAVFENVLQ